MATHSNILAWSIHVDRGAWRATVHGLAQSWTQLNQLSTQAGPRKGLQIRVSKPAPTHLLCLGKWKPGEYKAGQTSTGDILWRSGLPVGGM